MPWSIKEVEPDLPAILDVFLDVSDVLVVTDVLLHLLHGGAGDGSHPAGGPDLVPGVLTSVR